MILRGHLEAIQPSLTQTKTKLLNLSWTSFFLHFSSMVAEPKGEKKTEESFNFILSFSLV